MKPTLVESQSSSGYGFSCIGGLAGAQKKWLWQGAIYHIWTSQIDKHWRHSQKRLQKYDIRDMISRNIFSFTKEVSFIFCTSINMTFTKYFCHTLAWQCQHVKESLLLLVYSWYKKNRVKEVEGTLLCGEHT